MRNIVIVDGVRTGFGKLGGSLRQYPMSHLASMAIDGLLKKLSLCNAGIATVALFHSVML